MGKTDLGKWMITNGGEYSADATYEQLTMVKYGNSTYITLKTVTGITPVDDKINYQLMAQGFDATALSAVQAEDTQGLCGEKGNIVTAQSLVDALADKVINTVMTKIGTAALTGGMTDLSSGLNKLNSDMVTNGYNINPNIVQTLFAIVNGWDTDVQNVPSFVKKNMCILITVWVHPTAIGKLEAERNQVIFNGGHFAIRMYQNQNWGAWS